MKKKTPVHKKLFGKYSDASMLKSMPNPSKKGYEIKIKNPEITFLGRENQPDYATAFITMYPQNKVIELKSLKFYFNQFRNKIISYERLINVIYDDIIFTYNPIRLRVVMTFSARGGISSKLTIDSDWKIRGGKDKFKNYINRDEW